MVNIQRGVSQDFLIELGDSDDGLILDSSISKPRNHKHADEGTQYSTGVVVVDVSLCTRIFRIQNIGWRQ